MARQAEPDTLEPSFHPLKQTKTAALISKPSKPELQALVPEVVRWFTDRGYRIVMDQETAVYGANENVFERSKIGELKPDFVLVLGGDGTLLSAARAVSRQGVPILAVNLGSLGFLTEVALGDLYNTLEAVDSGQCPIELRSVHRVPVDSFGKVHPYFSRAERRSSK